METNMNSENHTNTELLELIKEKIREFRAYTPRVGIFGNSGVGKSSLCNALFGKEIAKISDVEACTRVPQEITMGSNDEMSFDASKKSFVNHKSGGITLIDFPGIGENKERHDEYTKLYKESVHTLDLVIWAIKADDRNYSAGLDVYNQLFKNSDIKIPVIFVITQVDKTNDSDDWDKEKYQPGGSQEQNILKKEHVVSSEFGIATNRIVSIAVSKKGRKYNITELVDLIVEVLPNEKKYAFTREAEEENVKEETRSKAEAGIWEAVKTFAGAAFDAVKDKALDYVIASAPKLAEKAIDWIKKKWF